MSLFARTDNSALGRWWWTVDRWILAALGVLMILGLLLNMAAGSAVAERIHLEATYFVKRHFLYLIPTLALLIGASLYLPTTFGAQHLFCMRAAWCSWF